METDRLIVCLFVCSFSNFVARTMGKSIGGRKFVNETQLGEGRGSLNVNNGRSKKRKNWKGGEGILNV